MTFSNDQRDAERKETCLAEFFQLALSILCNNRCEGQEGGRYWQMEDEMKSMEGNGGGWREGAEASERKWKVKLEQPIYEKE